MKAKADLIMQAIWLFAELDRMWERARTGLALSKAYYDQRPVSAEELAVIVNVSEDTIRRTVDRLLNINRVERVRFGRRTMFRATEEWAERTINVIDTALAGASALSGHTQPRNS